MFVWSPAKLAAAGLSGTMRSSLGHPSGCHATESKVGLADAAIGTNRMADSSATAPMRCER